jgi:hypothetical protein
MTLPIGTRRLPGQKGHPARPIWRAQNVVEPETTRDSHLLGDVEPRRRSACGERADRRAVEAGRSSTTRVAGRDQGHPKARLRRSKWSKAGRQQLRRLLGGSLISVRRPRAVHVLMASRSSTRNGTMQPVDQALTGHIGRRSQDWCPRLGPPAATSACSVSNPRQLTGALLVRGPRARPPNRHRLW